MQIKPLGSFVEFAFFAVHFLHADERTEIVRLVVLVSHGLEVLSIDGKSNLANTFWVIIDLVPVGQ